MNKTLPSPIACGVHIGCRYTGEPQKVRLADGTYMHSLPPIQGDMAMLQECLLSGRKPAQPNWLMQAVTNAMNGRTPWVTDVEGETPGTVRGLRWRAV